MGSTFSAFRSGLPVAAVLLLSACGGSGSDQPAAATTSAATSRFCTQAVSIQQRIGSTVQDPAQQANLPTVLKETASEIRAINAPPEIAADWSALADGAEQLSAVIGSVDPNQPTAFAGIEQQLNDVTSRLTGASTNVSNYLQNTCGIKPGPTGPTSPSS
jgi:hypothetical protein